MAQQDGLDLPGADPETTGLDQVHRLSPDDAMHALGVDDGDVASAVPAVVSQHFGRRLGPVEVPAEQRRRGNLQAANGFPVVRHGRPSSATSRVCTPSSGNPTQPGLRSPSTRVDRVISDSVLP